MQTAAWALVAAIGILGSIATIALFVWAARRDGEEDRALQERLGTRRRSRLGR